MVAATPVSSLPGPRPPKDLPSVVFVVFQTLDEANGGVESISCIIERLRRFRPVVVTQAETRATNRWRSRGISVVVWDDVPSPEVSSGLARVHAQSRRVLPLAEANVRIARLVRRHSARVVHCNDILGFWHAAPGAVVAGASPVFNIRDVFHSTRRYGLKWTTTRLLARRILVLSSEMRADVERRMRLPLGRRRLAAVSPIYSAVDPATMRPLTPADRERVRKALGVGGAESVIAYVGRCCPKKNQLEFIERAGPLLRSRMPEAVTYFIGDFKPRSDDYARRCADAVARLDLGGRMRFVGFSDRVAEWYQSADVVCLASRYEGLARAMIESVACATPVVSFDVCSAREILEEHGCGIVASEGDYAALVEGLVMVAHDAERRRAFGAAGMQIAARLFSPERVVEQYEDLYDELAQR